MREIKFKGLAAKEYPEAQVAKGQEVIGSLIVHGEHTVMVINEGDYVFVIPETVRQYTGLKTYDGVEVYEGDHLFDEDTNCDYVVQYAYGMFGAVSKAYVRSAMNNGHLSFLSTVVTYRHIVNKGFDDYSKGYRE